ncbi:MAG: PKD domain-containing protein [Flavobacteriales bacterium]|nr:MAG: PKD domain-containing protein [Flavobacteriales bacterium]
MKEVTDIRRWRALLLWSLAFLPLGVAGQFNVTIAPNNQPPYCGQEILTLQVNGVACGAGSTVTWFLTNGSVNIAPPPGPLCTFTTTFGVGCWDATVTVNGTTYPVIDDLFCVNPFPVASFTVSETMICEGGCITFTDASTPAGQIDTWTWTGLPCAEAANGLPGFSCCFPDAGTYYPDLTVFSNGCPDAVLDSIAIVVSDSYPTAVFSPVSLLDCPAPLDITLTNGSGQGLSSSWELTNTATGMVVCDAETTDLLCAGVIAGEYEACLEVTNSGGCSHEVCHPVVIFDAPLLDISVSPSPTCASVPVTFSAGGTQPASPSSVQWDIGCDGNVDGSGLNWSYAFSPAGTYQVCVQVAYSSTCVADTTLTIEVFDPLVAAFTPGDTTVCFSPVTLSFTNQSSGSGTLGYSWRVNGVQQATTTDLTWAFYASSLVELVVTNDQGCTATEQINVVIDLPELDVTGIPFGVCVGQTIAPQFDLEVIPDEAPYTYSWDFDGGGEDSNAQNPTWSYSATGNYSICLTVTTASGCTVTDCQSILVSPALDAGFGPVPQALCAGAGVSLQADNPDGSQYLWDFGDGWTVTTPGPSVNYMYNDTGCFDVTLTISNDGCMADSTITDAICIWGPVADFTITQSCTAPFEVSFSDQSIFADSLFWDFGDGTELTGDVVNDAPGILTPTHVYTNEGTYTVCLTAIADTSSCPHTRCFEVYIDVPSAELQFTPTSGCPPLCVVFSSTETYNVEWEIAFGNGDALVATAQGCTPPPDDIDDCVNWYVSYTDSPAPVTSWLVPFQGGDIFPVCVNYEDDDIYTITAIATNINGCADTTVYQDAITISTAPDFATFSYAVTNPCGPYCVDLTADNSLDSYLWSYRLNPFGPWVVIPGNTNAEALCLDAPPGFLEVRLEGDQGTCSDGQTVQVVFPVPAAASFIVDDTTPCVEQQVGFTATGAGVNGHAWTVDGSSVPGVLDMAHAFMANGLYEVCLSVVDMQYNCPDTTCQTVEVFTPVPAFEVIISPHGCEYIISVCDTSATAGNSYEYILHYIYPEDTSQVQPANSANPPVSFTVDAGVYDLEIIVNGPGAWSNCMAADTLEDLLDLGDVLGPWSWVPVDTVNCAPYCVEFEVFNPLAAGISYLWDFDDGTGGTGAITTHCYTDTGTYCPTLQVVFPNQCDAFFRCTQPIEVLPYAIEAAYDSLICETDTSWVEFTAAAPFGIDGITFVPNATVTPGPPWTFGLHPAVSSTFIATSSYAQCIDADTLAITVNPLPDVTADPFGPFCINAGTLPDPVVFPSPGTFTWPSPDNSPDPLVIGSGAHEVEYAHTDANGCSTTLAIPFTIHDTTAVVFDSIHACINADPFDLNPFVDLPGGTFSARYDGTVWTLLPALFDPGALVPAPTAAQQVGIRYIYENTEGCVSTNDTVLTVHPLPQVQFSAPDVCTYSPLTITNTSTITSGTIESWAWDIAGQGQLDSEQVGPFDYPVPDTIPVSLTATSDRGCVGFLDEEVIIHPVPVASFMSDDACQYDTVLYTDASTIGWNSGVDVIDTWVWHFGDGLDDVGPAPSHAWQGWGAYTDTLIVTSAFGCADTATRSLVIHPAPVNSMVVDPNCFGQSTTMSSTSSTPQGGIADTQWSMDSGPATYSGTTAVHTFSSAGFFPITLQTVSDQGCTTLLTDTLEIWPLPQVSFVPTDTVLCVNDPLVLTDVSTIPEPYTNNSWLWSINGTVTGEGPTLTHSFNAAGVYTIGLVVTSGNGCQDSLTISDLITVHPLPIAGFYPSPNRTGILSPEIQVVDTAQLAVEWAYDMGDGSYSTEQEPLHTYATFGTYLIQQIVTSIHGCLDTAYQEVVIDPDLLIYVPNSFTPDGDGINDSFLPSLDGFAVRDYNLTIWNRWGELIYETEQASDAWDGTRGGSPVQDGVYIWQIDLRAEGFVGAKRMRGHVTILR